MRIVLHNLKMVRYVQHDIAFDDVCEEGKEPGTTECALCKYHERMLPHTVECNQDTGEEALDFEA